MATVTGYPGSFRRYENNTFIFVLWDRGIDLAAESAGCVTIGQCEWAEYPTKVLERHWPDVPRWKDIRELTGESFYERTGRRTVDIISGGFPCQPFSVAGKQLGTEDDRYLWPEMVRVIQELRPTWVVGENVAGIVHMALPGILSQLEAGGYRTRTFLIPACAVGARHIRYRVAIVARAADMENSDCIGCGEQKNVREQPWGAKFERSGKIMANTKNQYAWGLPFGEKAENPGSVGSGKDVQHSNGAGCEELHTAAIADGEGFACGGCYPGNVCDTAGAGLPNGTEEQVAGQRAQVPEPERPDCNVSNTDNRCGNVRREPCAGSTGENGDRREDIQGGKEKHGTWERRAAEPGLGGMAYGIPDWMDGYWDIEPDIPRIAEGVPNRVGRLKALGNAVVPQQFFPVFKAIVSIELSR